MRSDNSSWRWIFVFLVDHMLLLSLSGHVLMYVKWWVIISSEVLSGVIRVHSSTVSAVLAGWHVVRVLLLFQISSRVCLVWDFWAWAAKFGIVLRIFLRADVFVIYLLIVRMYSGQSFITISMIAIYTTIVIISTSMMLHLSFL